MGWGTCVGNDGVLALIAKSMQYMDSIANQMVRMSFLVHVRVVNIRKEEVDALRQNQSW
jgi:hypothetical protein